MDTLVGSFEEVRVRPLELVVDAVVVSGSDIENGSMAGEVDVRSIKHGKNMTMVEKFLLARSTVSG